MIPEPEKPNPRIFSPIYFGRKIFYTLNILREIPEPDSGCEIVHQSEYFLQNMVTKLTDFGDSQDILSGYIYI